MLILVISTVHIPPLIFKKINWVDNIPIFKLGRRCSDGFKFPRIM